MLIHQAFILARKNSTWVKNARTQEESRLKMWLYQSRIFSAKNMADSRSLWGREFNAFLILDNFFKISNSDY